jgi:RNA polymerase sigma-70 factor (ECF subfamily)
MNSRAPDPTPAPPDANAESERRLVAGVRAGRADAAAELIARYQGAVLALCLRMLGHRHDAEDVVQETFLRAFRSLGGFDGTRPLRPWLLGIAANRCRTALTRRARRPLVADAVGDRPDPRPGLADPDDLAGELNRALARLRPEYRAVVVMYHDQNLSYEDIGIALDRPVGTIKTWLHRARGELAADLARRGVQCGWPGAGT